MNTSYKANSTLLNLIYMNFIIPSTFNFPALKYHFSF